MEYGVNLSNMSKYHKIWAKKRRRYIKGLLGYRCNLCGIHELLKEDLLDPKTQKPILLVFDCIIAQGDKHHKGSTDQRMIFYWKQYKANNLQLLCEKCHDKKSSAEHPQKDVSEFENFNDDNQDPF